MVSRVIKGYEIYKKDNIAIEHYEDDHIIFHVKNDKQNDYYVVSMVYGYWNCDCADFQYRNQKNHGSFYCKHLQAAQYKLLDLLKTKEKSKKEGKK